MAKSRTRRIPMEDSAVVEFKSRFRQLITESGLTHAQVAKGCGTSSSSISTWVNKKEAATPNVPNLVAIARFFGVALSWLTGECDSRNGLPPSHWLVDLDYVEALEAGDESVIADPTKVAAVPIPERAKMMPSADYQRLHQKVMAIVQRHMRERRGS